MRTIFATAAMAMLVVPAAARAEIDTDTQYWATTGASVGIGNGLALEGEVVLRFSDDTGGLYEAEFGGNLKYAVSPNVTIAAGYVYVPNFSNGHITRKEDRIRQQIEVKLPQKIGGGTVSTRLRLEERMRSNGNDIGYRLRPRVKWVRALDADKRVSLALYHESFIELNSTDWGQRGSYSRMRNFIGAELPLAKPVKLELGYLNQYNFVESRRDTMQHIVSASLSAKF